MERMTRAEGVECFHNSVLVRLQKELNVACFLLCVCNRSPAKFKFVMNKPTNAFVPNDYEACCFPPCLSKLLYENTDKSIANVLSVCL